MSSYRRATVSRLLGSRPGIQEVKLDFAGGGNGDALVLEDLVGSVREGDEVIANTTAVDLELGSGGYHFVLWNLERDSLDIPVDGHIMKLRYTPLQLNVQAVEEQSGGHKDEFMDVKNALEGIPVIAGSLHSQLLAAAVSYKRVKPEGRLVYIMTDGGSLPARYSNTAAFLREKGILDATITCGHAFGGDFESVNIYGALTAAKRVCKADAVIAIMGPGIVGTGTAVGFSGMDQATTINASGALGGRTIAIPRITFTDRRKRHRGLSHHTVAVLCTGVLVRSLVGFPVLPHKKMEVIRSQIRECGLDRIHDVSEINSSETLRLMDECGFEPTVMGKSRKDEPEYFMAAGAAGILAASRNG